MSTHDSAIAAALELELALDLTAGGTASLDDWLARYPGHDAEVRSAWRRREAALAAYPPEPGRSELVAALERDYADDRARGGVRSLAEYLVAHPSSAPAIAERLALLDFGRLVPDRHDVPELAPGTTLGRYRIIEPLGRGGQGTVYRATDTALQRTVAVKVLPPHGDRSVSSLARLAAEARAGSRVSHPGLCTVHDAGVHDDTAYLVMELVAGEPLSRSLERARSAVLDPQRSAGDGGLPLLTDAAAGFRGVVGFVAATARAVHVLHEAGLVHRDLKPANVMVTPAGTPVVLDLGLARDDEAAERTRTGDLFGTPAYMAPEQIELPSAELDRRVDVHAMGVLLYECVTLRHPFAAPTRAGTFDAILREPVLDPRRLQRGVSAQLALVIAKAMERDRARRYRTALELAEDLEAILVGAPIRARAPGPLRRLAGWRHRHPALATATLVVGLAAVVLVWQQERSREKLSEARDEAVAVNDFLVEKLLLSVTPEEARGREVRATDSLDAAAARVEQDFPAPTPVAAAIRHVLGRANARLTRWQEALRWYWQAAEMRTALLGPTHPDTVSSVDGSATALRELGRLDDVEALLATSLPPVRAALGPDHPATLDLEAQRGQLALARGDREGAAAIFAAVFDARRQVSGPDAAETLDAEALLARARAALGDLEAAERLFREVLRRRSAAFGDDDPQVHHARNDLASLLQDRDAWDEAAQLYEQVLDYAERVFGRESARYAVALNNAASLQHARGRSTHDESLLDAAESMFLESLAVREQVYGRGSEQVAKACNNLGLLLGDRGKLERSAEFLHRAVAIREQGLGKEHLDTVRTHFALAVTHWRQHGAEALPELAEVVDAAATVMGQDDPEYAGMLALTGLFACQADRPDEGIPKLERGYATLAAALGPTASKTRWAATQLAAIHRRLDAPEEAARWDARAR
ncbi:MAG: serine/threonine protein kinase [Planctomycetes bacterium]|nr:serine/threonine protein kinase [Planctomycetota bacterium]